MFQGYYRSLGHLTYTSSESKKGGNHNAGANI